MLFRRIYTRAKVAVNNIAIWIIMLLNYDFLSQLNWGSASVHKLIEKERSRR